jgi:flagella basal body P-ring formation protein FlgA
MKLLLAILVLAAPLAAQSGAELVINLQRDGKASGAFVRLADVATLTGPRADAAADVLLGRAPGPGEARALTREYIRMRLRQSGLDDAAVAIYGYERPLVRGAGRGWQDDDDAGARTEPPAAEPVAEAAADTSALITEALRRIRADLARRLNPSDATLHVTETGRSRSLGNLPAADLELLEVRPRHRTVSLGRLDYELEVRAGRETVRGLTLTVLAELEVRRVAAARDLPRGARLTAGDVRLETLRTTSQALPGFGSLADVADFELLRAVNEGETLTAQHTRAAQIVRRGDLVRVQATLPGGGRVTVLAEAQEAGARGDTIRLSRRIEGTRERADIIATITGKGEAEAR